LFIFLPPSPKSLGPCPRLSGLFSFDFSLLAFVYAGS
jgi:hypothetical protein